MTYQKKIGNKGEGFALDYLRKRGYQVLEQNYTTRYGEIDLIALDSDCLVFIEVKTRTSESFGLPESSITSTKIERITNTGLCWLQAHPEAPDDWRIDAIAVLIGDHGQVQDIHHFINVHL